MTSGSNQDLRAGHRILDQRSLLMGIARPAPWIFALLLVVVLTLVWAVAIRGFLLAGASAAPQVERE